MTPTTTTNLERISLDGPLGLLAAVAVGVVLLTLFGFLLWREQSVLGRRHALLFWVLRAAALATVIWMLLAPMNVRTETSTTRKGVAVITDVSGSMRTIDPPGSVDDVRWAAVQNDSQRHPALYAADEAIVAVHLASRQLGIANESLQQHRPESKFVDSTSAAEQALVRAREHLDVVERNSSGETQVEARALLNALQAPEFTSFTRLCLALDKGRTPAQVGWRESLVDLEHRIAGLKRSLREVAQHAAEDAIQQVARDEASLLADVRKTPRLGLAANLVGSLENSAFASIREQADVRLGSFDRAVQPLAGPSPRESLRKFLVERDGESQLVLATDVSAVLEQLHRDCRPFLDLKRGPLAAAFILTDVGHNQTGDVSPQDAAQALTETPVYVVPIGNTQYQRDVLLQSVSAPSVAMRNDDVVIEARLQAHECQGEVCTVQLLEEGEVVDFREVTLDSGFVSRTVRFERKMSEIGNQRLQLTVAPLNDELTEKNNYAEFEVNVTRSDIKVLVADEYPRWEYRYLSQLFRRDPKVECDELLFHPRMIATGRRAEARTFPTTVDEWDQYDVVMLGDLPTERLPVAAQESLTQYLQQRSGTLVLIAGQEFMPEAYADHPLGELLPVEQTDAALSDAWSFRVTEEGRDHHALMIGESDDATRLAWDFVNRFSPLHWVSPWRKPKPSAHSLIAAVPHGSVNETVEEESSFLCWQSVGRGRVVYLSGPDTYRLRLLRGDRLHYRFWGQLLRWAIASDLSAGSKFVRVRTDKSRYQAGEEVHVVVRLTDSEGEPVVEKGMEAAVTSGDDSRRVALIPNERIPGEYQADVRSLPPGEYRVEPVGAGIDQLQQDAAEKRASAAFTVEPETPLELIDTRCDRALAQQIADVTGGQVIPPTAVAEVLKLTDLEPIVEEKIETRPMWLEWKYLWIVFGCLQTEWIVRKWRGLS